MQANDSHKKVRFSGPHFILYAMAIAIVASLLINDSQADITEKLKWTPSDGAYADNFGTSVSIRGDYAVIGATGADTPILNSGAAYIFERSESGWTEVAKLVASDGAQSDFFGNAVAISGNHAVVGAYADDNGFGVDAGAVYFYKRSVAGEWGDQEKLVDVYGDDDEAFGWSVAIYGNMAIAGAYKHDDDSGKEDTGSAWVIVRFNNTWVPSKYLLAADRAVDDSFGYAVSISARDIIIGAFAGDGMMTDTGAAYVYHETSGTLPDTSWEQVAKLVASDGSTGDKFGYSVSISGNYALVGDPQDSTGTAYLFDIFTGPSAAGTNPGIPLLLLDN